MRILASLVFLLSSIGACAAQTADAGLPVCDPNVTKPEESLTEKYGPEVKDYIQQVVGPKIRTYWYSVVPEDAMPPLLRQGCLAVRFEILKNGTVTGLKYITSSGNVAMDRAASVAVTGSSPFPPVPESFKGQSLKVQFRFFYNPGFHPAHPYVGSVPLPALLSVDLGHTIPLDTLSSARILHVVEPQYPRKAIKRKIQGVVMLSAVVERDGKITSVSVVSGDPILSQAAADAVRDWTFEPFMKSGVTTRVQQPVKIEFRLGSRTGEPDFGFAPAAVIGEKVQVVPAAAGPQQ